MSTIKFLMRRMSGSRTDLKCPALCCYPANPFSSPAEQMDYSKILIEIPCWMIRQGIFEIEKKEDVTKALLLMENICPSKINQAWQGVK